MAQGDLSRSITIDAMGEVSELKDNINRMISNLKETTQKNLEQDWLKSNLATFSAMLQGQKSLGSVSQLLMSELPPLVSAPLGTFFVMDSENGEPVLALLGSYGYQDRKDVPQRFKLGEGLVGQCAREQKPILLKQVPRNYLQITSGLGAAPPLNLIVLPAVFEDEVKAVIELASFQEFTPAHLSFLEQLMKSLGIVLNMMTARMRTEELLQEVKRSNAGLEAQAKELEEKARLLQAKNKEVELASVSLEDRAEQLALISKYKSDFLANMSHELRTPLNSLMILAELLCENKAKNLTPKEVEYAKTIYLAGNDLLTLINEILDLSKVESGKMSVDAHRVALSEITDYVARTFQPMAQQKGLDFAIDAEAALPSVIDTDGGRLQQVLRNLLANAIKFTEQGSVRLRIGLAPRGMPFESEGLRQSKRVLAFTVTDTGIGVPAEKQRLIFEAFQQADTTTSRKYGGTGLGLTISREIAKLLGGEIRFESTPGKGSSFTLYLPESYQGPETRLMTPEKRAAFPSHVSFAPLEQHEPPGEGGDPLTGKTVLVVDDDVRNIFALTGVLENQGMKVLFAENGRDGLDLLQQHPEVDLVLMDLMMPDMSGDETIRAIRRIPALQALPILVVSAKALHGDREKSLEAGASDYLAKPVDTGGLLTMLRTWLAKEPRRAGSE